MNVRSFTTASQSSAKQCFQIKGTKISQGSSSKSVKQYHFVQNAWSREWTGILSNSATTGPSHYLFLFCGYLCIGLAVIGAVLPILPTTPFLILASSCFMRSNPKLQAWLMRVPVWGPMLRDWESHRAVKPGTKRLAFALMAAVIATTAVLGKLSLPFLSVVLVLVSIGSIAIWRLPVISSHPNSAFPSQTTEPVARFLSWHTTGRK